MIDHATRHSASTVIKYKMKEKIVDQIFGYPQKILVDNGGEYDNTECRDFYENMNKV